MSDDHRTPIVLPENLFAKGEPMPDSRAIVERRTIRSPIGNLVPIYCANCGMEAGLCGAGHLTRFCHILCPKCEQQWGMIAHELTEPHMEFWKAVARAQIETYSRILSREEVAKLLDDVNDPIAKLIRQGG